MRSNTVDSADEDVSDFLDTLRKFVKAELNPIASEVEETEQIPASIMEKMRELDLFGLTIPEEYGGTGLSLRDYCLVCMELAKTQQAFRALININNGIGSRGLLTHGSEQQRRRFLPGLARGERIAAFALTEPDGGSDIRRLQTRAEAVAGGFKIRGTKQFITNGPIANTILLIAATSTPGQPTEHATAFIVDTIEGDPAGLVRGAPLRKLGFHGSQTGALVFEDCVLPASAVVGAVGNGMDVALSAINEGRITVSAGAIGAAEQLLDFAIDYARTRTQFGRPLGQHQAIAHMIADMGTEIELATTLMLKAADARDRGGADTPKLASMSKLFATEMACRVADATLQIYGGYGYMSEYPIERYYRDLRLLRIVEGTSEIQRNLIARELLGRLERAPESVTARR